MNPGNAFDESTVRALEERRYAAMRAADVATLASLLDDALTYTHSSGVVDTKTSYLAGLRDGAWSYKSIVRENERVVIRAGCGLVFCRLRMDLDVRGTPRKVDSNALAVWVDGAGEPRLLAVHSSPVAP